MLTFPAMMAASMCVLLSSRLIMHSPCKTANLRQNNLIKLACFDRISPGMNETGEPAFNLFIAMRWFFASQCLTGPQLGTTFRL